MNDRTVIMSAISVTFLIRLSKVALPRMSTYTCAALKCNITTCL